MAGNREDIRDMDDGPQAVLTNILVWIDTYDLYGKVAFPKHHLPEDVSILYRLAALSRGIFVNPALTEPFGLTLLEAAATGLPLVATNDGGPQDIIGTCNNGLLVDALDHKAIGAAIRDALSDSARWIVYVTAWVASGWTSQIAAIAKASFPFLPLSTKPTSGRPSP